jgi:glucokinase
MTFLPTGGIYVTGGLALKHAELWITSNDSCFMQAYLDKGRASSILADIPLVLVQCYDMGLRGAVQYAQIKEREKQKNKKDRPGGP